MDKVAKMDRKMGKGRILAVLLAAAAFAGTLTAAAATVSTVAELQDALLNASTDDEIILSAGETPPKVYDLSTADCMHAVGHLYVTKKITLRGATGNPDDVVLLGSTNRILYLAKAGSTVRDLTFKNGNCTGNTKNTSTSPNDYRTGGGICFGATVAHNATVSNCVFTGCSAYFGGGAAMYYTTTGTDKIRYAGDFMDCLFTNCTALTRAAGAYFAGSLKKCTFVGNSTTNSCSGVYQCYRIESCDFRANVADSGGAVYGCGANADLGTNFVVAGCNFYTNSVISLHGAAISAYSASKLAALLFVTNCYFEGNTTTNKSTNSSGYGGAIYAASNTVDCMFVGNLGNYGGAAARSVLIDCDLSGNTGIKAGGGAYECTLTDCVVTDNQSQGNGGGTNGGTLTDCMVIGNQSESSGGGAYNGTLTGCTVSENQATSKGGGVYNSRLADCVVSDNQAKGYGGGVFGSTLTNCVVSGNQSTTSGGGGTYDSTLTDCVVTGNVAKTCGGGVYSGSATNCTIVGNTANTSNTGGGGAYESTLTGCALIGNRSKKHGGGAYNSTLTGCLIAGNDAEGVGGGAYGRTLVACTNRANTVTTTTIASGAEFYSGDATDCVFDGVGIEGRATFRYCALTRCRIVSTNGYLFSMPCGVTNCLIAGGKDFALNYSVDGTNSAFANCTIADNDNMSFSYNLKGRLSLKNCLFYGNNASSATPYDIGSDATRATFTGCIFSLLDGNASYASGSGNYDYWGNDTFNPGFVGAAGDPQNPYAITRQSPAFHVKSAALGVTGDASFWTEDDTDIRGEGFPRLRNEKVDIGCYQCWLEPPGLAVTIR